MKTYYLYVPDGDKFAIDSIVIRLVVGTSKREQTKFALLQHYAGDLDQFLRIIDEDTDFWLDQHAKRIIPDSNCPRLHMNIVELSIVDCYRMIIDGTLESYCKSIERPKGYLNMLIKIDANFMRFHAKNNVTQNVPSGVRKYLSHNLKDSICVGIALMALMIGVGTIDRIGELLIALLF